MSRFSVFIAICLLGMSGALAQTSDLAGRYRIEGRNPSGSGIYRGGVLVSRNGDAYHVRWQLGRSAQVGTGLVLDKVFAVTFQAGAGPVGVAAFRINADGSLTGIWAGPGTSIIGTESWVPADRS